MSIRNRLFKKDEKGHEVFISYSVKDKEIADKICHALESNSMNCWIGPRNIRTGKNYVEEIIGGIENAKIVVLVFSKSSNESKYVVDEIAHALQLEKPIIVFRIDETPTYKDYILQTTHWIYAYPFDEEKLEILIQDVSKLITD